ncbi:BTB/POZ domain-containing protein [Rhizophagus clarus]|uniref:BTB/POZ domain-containing protein n=1 Tax=Rhizophagus clarus TaxID=94130 RepID=A0A8H3KXE1_9GLOM|nr:BTB/POZ domain-containing protein [Rhizophagus clarus]
MLRNGIMKKFRDGYTAAYFHNKCDNKGVTVVVVKVINSAEQIIGGYNPIFWDSSNTWKITYDSFIFSFTSKENLQSAIVPKQKKIMPNNENEIQAPVELEFNNLNIHSSKDSHKAIIDHEYCFYYNKLFTEKL